MDVAYDPAKIRLNVLKHGVPLDLMANLDFETALIDFDDRYDYGEERMIALGYIGDMLFVAVFIQTEAGIRAISLRRAEPKERRRYAETP